ncbi:metallothionein expression activator [Podospora conica]|nr:metallothionein expression activator [Schizothecium conicum]
MSAYGTSHHTHHALLSDIYDPDDVVPRSPGLQPLRPTLKLSPTPPLEIYETVSPGSSCPGSPKSSYRGRIKVKPIQGDVVLLNSLDGNRRPEIGMQAGLTALPSDTEGAESPIELEDPTSPGGRSVRTPAYVDGEDSRPEELQAPDKMALDTDPGESTLALISLAAGALAVASPPSHVVDAGPTPPVTENDAPRGRPTPAPLAPTKAPRHAEPPRDDRPPQPPLASPYSPRSPSFYSPSASGAVPLPPIRSPSNGLLSPALGQGLPPIQHNSPRSDISGPLPSITAQFGDLAQLTNNYAQEAQRQRHSSFPHSPPSNQHPSMHHGTPPISPNYPYATAANVGGFNFGGYPPPHRQSHDYASSTATPGSEQSGSTPATSIAEPLEGLSIHSATAQYRCTFQGCNAAPFQTQYLLNSHANVHSSSRPHYCPVSTCPRSEGGKGFKRKNEMIRHGLVHDSPGYVCPFCPDRDHKYPRPDNLQRHVRVHHIDKDKEDPLLRDVLAQRPDGPSRGRRRRGVQN